MAAPRRDYLYAGKKLELVQEPVVPPDAVLVRQRWISRPRRDWVLECDRILMSYGVVQSATIFPNRRRAQWHAAQLIKLMMDLRLHERDELTFHSERHGDEGWIWLVEYRPDDGKNKVI